MAKRCSVTSLVALTLLGCLVGTKVEAQDLMWAAPPYQPQKKVPPVPGSPTFPQYPSLPQVPQYPSPPQVQPPWPPKVPQYPTPPQVQPPSPPKVPQYPPLPQVQPPWPPKVPQYPTPPQVQPPSPPKVPQYPTRPQVQPPSPPKVPQYPYPPKVPQYPTLPQVQPPSPPKVPQYPTPPQVQPPRPPKVPTHPQVPQVQRPRPPPNVPPKVPQYPQVPQVQPPQPPKVPPRVPQYPQVPQVQPPQPPKVPPRVPQYPQVPQVQPPLPPKVPPRVPQYPQQDPITPPPNVTPSPQVQTCDVGDAQKVPCGGLNITTAAACKAISCCFDGQQCYFGKAVTVQCTKDAQFIVVVARDATLPNIDLSSILLLGQGQGCTYVDSNSQFAIYQFPVTACGSVVMEQPGVIIYQNRMSSSYDVGVGPLGSITRDSHYDVIFQCRYIGTSVETVVVEVLTLSSSSSPLQVPPLPVAALGPITVQLRLANGQCYTKGCNEVDAAYSSFYTTADYPVTKVLRDPVYVEIELAEKTDPQLVLTLGRCWTTTTSDPHSLPQWDILINGCPYKNDHYLSSLVPVGPSSGLAFPSHYRRFIFKMFTFVDANSMAPQKEMVYLHCSTAVCTATTGQSCEPSCSGSRKKRDDEAVDQEPPEPKVVVSVGPLIMSVPEQQSSEHQNIL